MPINCRGNSMGLADRDYTKRDSNGNLYATNNHSSSVNYSNQYSSAQTSYKKYKPSLYLRIKWKLMRLLRLR